VNNTLTLRLKITGLNDEIALPGSAPATITCMTPDDSPKSLRVMTCMSYLRPGSRCLIIAHSSRDGGVATRHCNVPDIRPHRMQLHHKRQIKSMFHYFQLAQNMLQDRTTTTAYQQVLNRSTISREQVEDLVFSRL